MDLNPEQKNAVAQWVREGASLSDVQKRLREEHDVNLTYMEVRFLVDDLDLSLKEDPKANHRDAADALAGTEPAGGDDSGSGGVSVSLDKVVRAGAVVSGSVTFSGGQRAQWHIDSMGRLGLNPEQEGFQPGQEEVAKFQEELQRVLQKSGF